MSISSIQLYVQDYLQSHKQLSSTFSPLCVFQTDSYFMLFSGFTEREHLLCCCSEFETEQVKSSVAWHPSVCDCMTVSCTVCKYARHPWVSEHTCPLCGHAIHEQAKGHVSHVMILCFIFKTILLYILLKVLHMGLSGQQKPEMTHFKGQNGY